MMHIAVSEGGTIYSVKKVGSVPTLHVDNVPVALTADGAGGEANDIFIVE